MVQAEPCLPDWARRGRVEYQRVARCSLGALIRCQVYCRISRRPVTPCPICETTHQERNEGNLQFHQRKGRGVERPGQHLYATATENMINDEKRKAWTT